MNSTNSLLVVRLPEEAKKALSAQANEENISMSELARQYIQKGLDADVYRAQINQIVECTETAVRQAIAPQIERLVKLLMKIGKINGSGYYLQLANILNDKDREDISTTSEIVGNCNRLALKYMSQKDSDVEAFLLNNGELVKSALHIKSPMLDYLSAPADIDFD